MNIKGKSRAGGRELADHLLNAEKNETVKVLSIDGTVAQDLHGAFQEMEAAASGTRCKKPLYHAKISPDPKEPAMTPEQWDRSIIALRDQLGLTGHAYAAVLHSKYGAAHPDILREHMHVVFCRIDPDTMLAMHDGHNYRQHELVARQLEQEFGHARIQGAHVDRDGVDRPQRTPPDWAMQQAAKSGIQPRDVADTVKELWTAADNAHSFAAALEQEGLTLAVGRRDLVILDAAGDVHTLARCLNLKVADIRERLAEIDRSQLPTVDQARDASRDRQQQKSNLPDRLNSELAEVDRLIANADPGQLERAGLKLENDKVQDQIDAANRATARNLKHDLAKIDEFIADASTQRRQQDEAAPMWDRDGDDRAWQDAVANAAIEKEKIERRFVEPGEAARETRAGQHWPVMPPQPEPVRTSPALHFEDAARETAYDHRPQDAPDHLRGTAAEIWLAYHRSDNAKAFAAALDEKGIALAVVTKDEAERSRTDAAEAKEKGSYAPVYRENEIVAVDDRAYVYRLNERTTGSAFGDMQRYLRTLDRSTFQGIDGTRQMMHDRAAEREAAGQVFAALNPVKRAERAVNVKGRSVSKEDTRPGLVAKRGIKKGVSLGAGIVNTAVDAISSLFAPPIPLTRQQLEIQIEESERIGHAVAREAAAAHHWQAYTDEHEQIAARHEGQAREAQQRDDDYKRQRERER